MEIGLYPGCTAHSTGLEYSMSLHAVLDNLDVQTVEMENWNCCGAAAAHSLSKVLGLALPARNVAIAQEMGMPVSVPCAGCFNAMRRAQSALSEEGDLKDELEEAVGFSYNGEVEFLAMIDVVLKNVGLEKVSERVTKPLDGLRVACYYGCALVRRPEIADMGDHENPVFMESLAECLGARPVTKRVPYGVAYNAAFLMELFGHMFGRKSPPLVTRYSVWLMGRRCFFSCEKARRELDWQPTIGYDQGIQQAVGWSLANAGC